MSWERLQEVISDEVRAEVDIIVDRGRQEALRLRAAAESDIARWRAEQEARIGLEVLSDLERELGGGRRRAQRQLLEARRDCLDRIRATALSMIREPTEVVTAREMIRIYAEETLAHLGNRTGVLLGPAGSEPTLEMVIRGRDELEFEVDPGVGCGVQLRTTDGRLLIDNTLAGRLDRMWPALEVFLVDRIEGQDEPGVG